MKSVLFIFSFVGWILKSQSVEPMDGNQTVLLDWSFHNLTILEHLDKSEVKILNVSHSMIESIGILESETISEIDLSYGQLRWVRVGSFRHVNQLEKLYIHDNRHLTTIDLEVKSLVYLDASHCSVTEASFHYAPNLRILNLSHNRIKEIRDGDLTEIGNLQELDLSDNDIEIIYEYAFIKQQKLTFLNLARNQISNIDWTITLKNLTILHLDYNLVENIELMFLKQVIFLNMSHNKLTELPEEIERLLPNLEHLDASSNPIRKINRIKSNKLQKICLRECKIKEIGRNALMETSLQFIDVSDNKLREWGFVLSAKPDAVFLLHDNPWQCVCNVTIKFDIFCQMDNITIAEFCANQINLTEPWFVEFTNPAIWAPLIVALVIIIFGCVGLRAYYKLKKPSPNNWNFCSQSEKLRKNESK